MSQIESNLVEKIEDVLRKLEEIEQTIEPIRPMIKEATDHIEMMQELERDIYCLTQIRAGKEDTYASFKLYVAFDGSLNIFSPDARILLGDIDKECLRQKTLYQCLDEKFSNKVYFYDILMKELSNELGEFLHHLKALLPTIQNIDWIKRRVEELKETVKALSLEIERKEEE